MAESALSDANSGLEHAHALGRKLKEQLAEGPERGFRSQKHRKGFAGGGSISGNPAGLANNLPAGIGAGPGYVVAFQPYGSGLEKTLSAYRTKGGLSSAQLDSLQKTAEADIQSLDRTLTLQNSYQMNLQPLVASLKQKISTGDIGSEARNYIDNQIAALQKLAERQIEYISVLLTAKKLKSALAAKTNIWMRIVPNI